MQGVNSWTLLLLTLCGFAGMAMLTVIRKIVARVAFGPIEKFKALPSSDLASKLRRARTCCYLLFVAWLAGSLTVLLVLWPNGVAVAWCIGASGMVFMATVLGLQDPR